MPTAHTLETGVLRLEYAQDGPADAPVALLLHGFPRRFSYLGRGIGAAVAAGYQPIAPSMRGELDGASLAASSEGNRQAKRRISAVPTSGAYCPAWATTCPAKRRKHL